MKRWSFVWHRTAGAPAGAVPGAEIADPVTHVPGGAPAPDWKVSEGLEAWHDLRPVRLTLELDEGVSVPVSLEEGNAAGVLETTQRMREYREREKASVPPVVDFGGESVAPGGDW